MELRYFGTVEYFATMGACNKVIIADDALYDKRQKEAHRCEIADTHGIKQLTVPVCKPHGVKMAKWNQVQLSDHGAYWHVHRVTLESAYGRTPFFEFYIDDLMEFLCPEVLASYPTVGALDVASTRILVNLLQLPAKVMASSECTPDDMDKASSSVKELNALMHGVHRAAYSSPYYQVRQQSQGFLPNLSVLDLLFNMGPEAPLYLQRLLDKAIG